MKINLFKRREDTFDYESDRLCIVCNHSFKGRYCNVCGEKITEPHERTILFFFGIILNAFTFLDGKFLRSIKLILTNPGALSRNISEGKRVIYMNLVSLFFVANFFYFLFQVFDSYSSSLYTQMNLSGYHNEVARDIVERKIKEGNATFEDFEVKYNSQSANLSKLLIIILVLAFSGILAVVNIRKQEFFFNHLLFSLEFYGFQLLFISVFLANLFRATIEAALLFGLDWEFILADNVFSFISVFILLYFLTRGQIEYYSQRWYWAIPKAVILVCLLQGTVMLYRIMLFHLTISTL